MKRALAVIGIIVGALTLTWLTGLAAATRNWTRAGREPWPAALGTLRDFPKQFPKRETSAAAKELMRLAAPLRLDFGPRATNDHPLHAEIAAFVERHHARDRATIDPLPRDVAVFFDAHAREIDAVRDHLLRRGREVAWTIDLSRGFEAPVPNLLAHTQLARLLVARAQVRGDWADLHAASALVESLDARPELMVQLSALSLARGVNAAAWKMPLPAPAWLAAMHEVDRRRLLLRGLQYESWTVWRHLPYDRRSLFGPPARPFLFVAAANLAEHQRSTAAVYLELLGCGFDPEEWDALRAIVLPQWNVPGHALRIDFAAPWAQVMRYGAEREATMNVFRIRRGEPVVEHSAACGGIWRGADGQLSYERMPWLDRPAQAMPLSVYTRASAAAID